MGTFRMISLFVTTHRDTKIIKNLFSAPMLKWLHIFFAITLGLLKIKNNSLISRGGEGSQLCLQHNKQTTAVFTSFVDYILPLFATPSPTLSKIYELYQSGNPKGARWAFLARSGNQSEPRASDCPRVLPAQRLGTTAVCTCY